MRKLMKLMAIVTLVLPPLLVGVPASAQQAASTCEVGYTGPNSENMCTITYECSVDVENNNEVTITDSTGQEVASGDALGDGATSGTVTNDSGTVFNVTIINESQGCTATRTVPATEPPVTVVPTGEGQGAVEVLPETSGDTTLQTAGIIAGSLLLVAALSVGGVLWYRHQKAL